MMKTTRPFDRYINLIIRCKDYDKRKDIVTKKIKVDGQWTLQTQYDENGKIKLKQIDNDLPGTVKDIEDWKELLTNFKFP